MKCEFCGGPCKKIPKKEWGAGSYRCKSCGRSQVNFDMLEKLIKPIDLSIKKK